MNILSRFLVPFILAALACPAAAEVQNRIVDYKDGETTLRGHLYWDDRYEDKRAGVLVVHEWWGLNAYAKMRARMLAEAGYVAFAPDMYGDGKVTEHASEAKAWKEQISANVDAWVQRAKAGLDQLKELEQIDPERIAAIGYCFGGTTVMQMAYAGMDVKGVASFHGSLPPPPESLQSVAPRILVAHGRDDAFIPAERIVAFQSGLDRIGADWEMTIYSGTRHGFTNPGAGDYGIDNLAYNETADKRSWAATKRLFDEVFE